MDAKTLRKKYFLTKVESEKAEFLLVWFLSVSPRGESIEETEFRRRYWWLFRRYPLFYCWGPFWRDHGRVGLCEEEEDCFGVGQE